MEKNQIKVAVIGAGPVGIAAAAHLIERGIDPLVLERGQRAGHAMKEWGHVRVFTPWQYVTDKAVVNLLTAQGWQHPAFEEMPTGQEIVDQYLVPASQTAGLKGAIVYDAEVTAISKVGLSKSLSHERDTALYTVHYKTSSGAEYVVEADGVIDASGTWYNPNPIGADGLPVLGEKHNKDNIAYGIPDALGVDKEVYKGKRTLVLGGGHSAINIALDILKLKDEDTKTKLFLGVRRNNLERLLGGGINDELPARGELGLAAKQAIEEKALKLLAPFQVHKIEKIDTGLQVSASADNVDVNIEVDRIVVATGFRPDLQMLRELRLELDEVVEAPKTLAPMIDPNLHSCGTVKPHGVDELSHPDKNFFIVGMKSYGRAPTFLMLTGYEQVRSIAAELAGDFEAARQVELNLPETGVCNSRPQEDTFAKAACCAGSTEELSSCCV